MLSRVECHAFWLKMCKCCHKKKTTYTVYVHLNQANRNVVYSNSTCVDGKGEHCRHIVALLFQIIKYKQFNLTEIPDHLTSSIYNYYLQQWHLPRKDESGEPCVGTFYLEKQFTRKIPRVKNEKKNS